VAKHSPKKKINNLKRKYSQAQKDSHGEFKARVLSFFSTLDTASNRYLLAGGMRERHFAVTSLEPRKLLENAATPTCRVHLRMMAGDHFPPKKPSSKSILRISRSTSRTKQWRRTIVAVPRCTLVAGPIDLTTGGEGGKTPMRKLTSERTGTCVYW
jgi:hypothetical protein